MGEERAERRVLLVPFYLPLGLQVLNLLLPPRKDCWYIPSQLKWENRKGSQEITRCTKIIFVCFACRKKLAPGYIKILCTHLNKEKFFFFHYGCFPGPTEFLFSLHRSAIVGLLQQASANPFRHIVLIRPTLRNFILLDAIAYVVSF